MEKHISIGHWAISLVLFAATIAFQFFVHGVAQTQRFLPPPPEHMELFHFGFPDSIADSLWLRWIQDNDTCQTYAGKQPLHPILPNEGEFHNPRNKYCDNSWSFKMLDSITLLAPRFEMPYLAGAITLSVLVEDYEGAKVIFDRGLREFPNDWQLLYRASYHYLFDRQDYAYAAQLMARARIAGAPPWLAYTAARLYSKSGQIELGIKTLEEYKKTVSEKRILDDVDKRIENLRKQLDQ